MADKPKDSTAHTGKTAEEELQERSLQRERAVAWLRENWKNNSCVACGTNSWQIGDVFELRAFHGGTFYVGPGPLLPVIPVICNHCGNTMFLNALKAGAVVPPTPPETREDDDE